MVAFYLYRLFVQNLAKHFINYKLDNLKKIESLLNSPTITTYGGTLAQWNIKQFSTK